MGVHRSAELPRMRFGVPGPGRILLGTLLLTAAVLLHMVVPAGADGELGGPLPGLTPEELGRFETGAASFSRVHTPEDGLGPVFNGRACAECHSLPVPGGADKTRSHLIVRIGREAGGSYDD